MTVVSRPLLGQGLSGEVLKSPLVVVELSRSQGKGWFLPTSQAQGPHQCEGSLHLCPQTVLLEAGREIPGSILSAHNQQSPQVQEEAGGWKERGPAL